MVKIRLLDYGGCPLPDLPFVLFTKKKGELKLRTDADGCCEVQQDWLTNNEKMRVKFEVTPEYRQTHDIHDGKTKKK